MLRPGRHLRWRGRGASCGAAEPFGADQRPGTVIGGAVFHAHLAQTAADRRGKATSFFAERALADMRSSRNGRRVRAIEEGTVSFGTFNSAHLYLLTDLIRDFHALHPGVRIQVAGLNSAEVADAVRDGRLEAGLVQLPVDDRELMVTPWVFVDQVVYVSKRPSTHGSRLTSDPRERPLILSEARWSQDDPLRVSLLQGAQRGGITLAPIMEVGSRPTLWSSRRRVSATPSSRTTWAVQ